MKNMGVTFEIPNEFLFNHDRIISGEKLYESSKSNTYYMIFVTLRAFLKDGTIKGVSKHKEFLERIHLISIIVDK